MIGHPEPAEAVNGVLRCLNAIDSVAGESTQVLPIVGSEGVRAIAVFRHLKLTEDVGFRLGLLDGVDVVATLDSGEEEAGVSMQDHLLDVQGSTVGTRREERSHQHK